MDHLEFEKIEKKWQKKWEESRIFEADEKSKKQKFYCLEMFPYPSGSGLHMGHALNYTIGDIFARFKRMKGFNVLHPMGYDALGLPAENAAIKVGIHPEEYTKKSMKSFTSQLKTLGFSYDWSRMLNTSDSDYYKWDQWIFLKMFEKGLAYRKESAVNWCPECNTVLANEQVVEGKCWRHDKTRVEIKSLKQWFLKITNYADEIFDNIDDLEWPERTKQMQKHWIGKSYGAEIDFEVNGKNFSVFTTRPDTIYGVTFMVVSPYHKNIENFITKENRKEFEKFMKKLKSVSEKEIADLEKEGVFTGSYAVNPVNGEEVPIYLGNFVVADYGSGMVMAVPAHDKRDFEFAKKYGIKIKVVIDPVKFELNEKKLTEAYVGEGSLVNSGEFDGIPNEKAKELITSSLMKKNIGRKSIQFRLKDWGISRQRYWGTPIPIIYCEKCGAVPVPEKDLPVKLPKEVKFGEGNPILSNERWINVKCPKCKGGGKRETDTMDTFVNSSWYFLRYCDPNNQKEIFNKKMVSYWSPVDVYIGGAEHACMHLIYSRFYTKFLRDFGMINFDEPTKRLFHQGMLHAEDGEKMSKSKGNVVEPLETIKKYGVDATRLFLVSVASPDKDFDWSEKGIQGSFRFVKKICDFYDKVKIGESKESLDFEVNQSIKEVEENIEIFEYRKATIKLREVFDSISKEEKVKKKILEDFLKILSPFCPHITEELWEKLGNKNFISISLWPEYKEMKMVKKVNEDLNSKYMDFALNVIRRFEENGEKIVRIYFYVVPFEMNKINQNRLEKGLKKKVFVYSVQDKKKHDPEGKSKKARPGIPGIWFE
ncbi:leucine--tRNA ligase [Candidatus Pacearchaeota archaeon CG10_big_fil_rev_8_21_14_0_10_32_42]|nr:MAG: leucine--tRNA ligase [Candidatus Pacearchaeota archaeon CG10_big_fil_rev_8_21_14_0_10_32_42]